jgi:hypothetical protein
VRVTLGVVCLLPSIGVADLTLRTVIESSVDSAQVQILAATYIKGPWLRRESQGEGVLADLLGARIEITNRQSGETFRLYPDHRDFTVDTSAEPSCGAAHTLDWRMLGRVRPGTRARLHVPDTTRVIQGCEVSLLQVEVPAARGGTTILDIWVCPDYRALFGPGGGSELFCGDSTRRLTDHAGLAESLRRQFRLSAEDEEVLRQHLGGYPLRIESVSTLAASVSRTLIRLDGWSKDDLPDSLFRPPTGYRRSERSR